MGLSPWGMPFCVPQGAAGGGKSRFIHSHRRVGRGGGVPKFRPGLYHTESVRTAGFAEQTWPPSLLGLGKSSGVTQHCAHRCLRGTAISRPCDCSPRCHIYDPLCLIVQPPHALKSKAAGRVGAGD